MHVHEFGDAAGRPVVALHGIRGHGARWRRLAERHLGRFRVLAPDLRGHGRSPATPPWTLEQHVSDLLAVLDERGVREFDVVGHSFGGLIGVQLALTAPERVGGLALLDPSIGLDPGGLLEQARQALSVPSYADAAEARVARAAGWPPQAVDDEIGDHLTCDADGRRRWRFEPAAVVAACSEMARAPVVPPATVRTLLVIATRSGFVRPEYVTACRAALGDALTVAALDSGHMVYLDRPDETGTLLHDFLADARQEA